jgi:hypothetical protein
MGICILCQKVYNHLGVFMITTGAIVISLGGIVMSLGYA